jgi:hypothetical protein
MARLTSPAFVELDPRLRLSLEIGPTTFDPFTDEELELAWEQHREELMEPGPSLPGSRPWAWWFFEAGREEYLTPYPLDFEGTTEEHAEAINDHYIEPVVFLAKNGFLTDDELAAIAEKANEAKTRVGTKREHWGSGGVDRSDRRAVELWRAVEKAISERSRRSVTSETPARD